MMRGLLSAAAFVAAVLVAWVAHAASIDAHIAPQLAAAGRTDVLVLLQEPEPAQHRDLQTRRQAIAMLHGSVTARLRSDDIRIQHEFAVVSGFTASVSARGLEQLQAHPAVLRVDAMRYGSGALARSVPQIRADAVHHRDDNGQNVTVAVLDTGVDSTHPDVSGRVVGEQCFCSGLCCPDGSGMQAGSGSAHTNFVHGMHVTGIIASNGTVAAVGVAPAVQVVAVKVLDDGNRGSLLDWIRGLEWIVTDRPDVQAINMSLVSDQVFPGYCDTADGFNMAFKQVLEMLRARGTLTFVASGNTGDTDALTSPACVKAAVAVGAVDHADAVADFSSSGPALDLLAPGVAIESDGPGHSVALLSGTSMATAFATGTAALVLAVDPTIGADRLETVLKQRGVPVLDARNQLTSSRINALAAMTTVYNASQPLRGGGSGVTDCLVEWRFVRALTSARGVASAQCHDDDPSCDDDGVPGQCTFRLSVCFNVTDPDLPRCTVGAMLTDYRLVSPTAASGAIDAANAAAITSALPGLPITTVNRCSSPISFVVPAGAGPRWIRFVATAADGRRDPDHIRMTCLP